MIDKRRVNEYCSENFTLIENYDKAINDDTQTWDCHHRLEELGFTQKDLKYLGLYYKVPASELIFMTHSDHIKLHQTGHHHSIETKIKISEGNKDRVLSEETKQKISIAVSGENHPNWNKPRSESTKRKIREANKDVPKPLFKWQTPEGDIKIMGKANATYWHPNWKFLGPIE